MVGVGREVVREVGWEEETIFASSATRIFDQDVGTHSPGATDPLPPPRAQEYLLPPIIRAHGSPWQVQARIACKTDAIPHQTQGLDRAR